MALTGKTISQLPELTAITSNAEFVIEQSGTTYKIKNSLFNNTYLPLSGGTVSGGTIFNGGLTANTISATTYYNLPIDIYVTGGTYTNGEATFTNNTGGTFTVSGFPIGSGGGQLFYLNLSETKGSNRYLSTTASTSPEQTVSGPTSSGATSSVATFQSDQLGINLIPGGVWSFYLHSYKQNSNASFDIYVDVYKRTTGNTLTLLFSTDPTPVLSDSPTLSMQLTDAYFSGCPLSITDSIDVVVMATNTSNQTYSLTFATEGTQHYSYVVSSIPTQQALTCDTLSGCSTIQSIQSNKFDKSGGTINGDLTANTISASTYQNVPSFVNLSFGHSSIGPADATTYYIGALSNLTPSTANRDAWTVNSQYTGNITEVSIISNFGGGSSGNSTMTLFNLSAGTSQVITSTLQYISGTPVQILSEPFNGGTQPAGWSSSLTTFASGYAGLTGTTSTLTSPVFDGTSYASINIQSDVAKFGAGTDGPVLIEYSLNSGSTWTSGGTTAISTGSTNYVTSTVSIPTTSSQMAIRFSVNPTGTSGKRVRNVFFNGLSSSINNNYVLGTPLAVTSGDKLQIRWVTPTWTTNPSGVTNLFNLKLRL